MHDESLRPYLASNPLHDRSLVDRNDVEHAMHRLLAPLDRYRSPGSARVRLSPFGAAFDAVAAELEGFARPLWAVAAASAGGTHDIDWRPYREGLANGTDPTHEEYWRAPRGTDQRQVELAAIGFALLVAPSALFDPLDPRTRARVRRYLSDATRRTYSPNNWMFFRLLIDAGLRATGDAPDAQSGYRERVALDALYLGDGWYSDGPERRVDHYNGFAFHTYGLLLSHFAPHTDRGHHLERARLFAPSFARWFDERGRVLAFGRSMTYRFAAVAFFAAYALADPDPVLPYGVLKGIVLRHLRWWAEQPIADRDGVLSIGYAYPDPHIAEQYSSPGSPYWSMKAFLMLAMPSDHPFWTAEELPLPRWPHAAQSGPRFVVARSGGAAVALSAGQKAPPFRHGAEKYGKLCYSSAHGPCVEMRGATLQDAAVDSTLAVGFDDGSWCPRDDPEFVDLTDAHVHSRWTPREGVRIDTLTSFCDAGHVRLHRVRSDRELTVVEGGFAAAETTLALNGARVGRPIAGFAAGPVLMDLSRRPRTARLHRPAANVGLLHPRVVVPRLECTLPPGEWVLETFCGGLRGTEGKGARAALDSLASRLSVGGP